jgi:drug/metabolite transporter (DMT)-like permease
MAILGMVFKTRAGLRSSRLCRIGACPALAYTGHPVLHVHRLAAPRTPPVMNPPARALSGTAFATLLVLALMFGANHVAARLAFNNGVDVTTAVFFRSAVTALVIAGLLLMQGRPAAINSAQWRLLLVLGCLISIQSFCIYSAVARLPVALALLAFNSYPMWTALWARVLYAQRPERALLVAMPVILAGLALALDVLGAASGLGASEQWSRIGAGVGFALMAAASFGLALVLTQHKAGGIDARLRTAVTLAFTGCVALLAAGVHGGFHFPTNTPGWIGLGALTLLYGVAFSIMFAVLPRLGVVGNSAIMNVEPVFALALAWLLLGQTVAPVQVLGALVVVGAVMYLGLRKR